MKNYQLRKRYRMVVPSFLVMTAVAALLLTGVTMARYVRQQSQKGIVEAKDFYFTSDFLKEESEHASYYVDPGKNFTIKLYNYADTRRVTPGDVAYSIQVDGGSASSSSGVLSGTAEPANMASVEITPNGSSEQVMVTATTTAPYKKTLTAVFYRKMGNQFTVEDAPGNRAAALVMTCADSGKPIVIDLPEGVYPDETDERVTYGGNQCIFISPGEGVYSLVLLKSDTALELTGKDGVFADRITILGS